VFSPTLIMCTTMGGNTVLPLERLGQSPAGGDSRACLHHGPFDDAIPADRAVMSRPSRMGTPGGDQGTERPGEPRDGDLANEHPDDRHLQQERVDDVAALIGVVVALDPVDHAGAHCPP